jgi:hypothetical protein
MTRNQNQRIEGEANRRGWNPSMYYARYLRDLSTSALKGKGCPGVLNFPQLGAAIHETRKARHILPP